MRRIIATVLAAVVTLATGSAAARGEGLGGEGGRGEFVVSYWYGPPPKFTTIEHYRRIKEANFNVVFPPGPPDTSITPAQNHQILDFCRELGMRAVVFDPRMPRSLAAADAKAKIEAIVAEYAAHPALMAYFIVDEPGAGDFAALGEVVSYLKQRDPRHPGYINLFPMHAAPWAQLGTATYEEYVDRFIKLVDPAVLSYDHYPFTNAGDNPHYFTNLAVLRNAGVASKRDFWNIAQLVQHYDYRALSEPELRFQAMQTLAFGGRGLLWYTYWYPGEPNPTVKHAMIAHDGTPEREYAWIAVINADARAIGDALIASDATSWATFHTGRNSQYAAPPKCPIAAGGEGELTIGVFKGKADANFALVANRDYREPVETAVRVSSMPAGGRVEQFDPARRKWLPALTARPGRGGDALVRLSLPPGEGVLLRW